MSSEGRTWQEVAALERGELEDCPYPVLLAALARARSNVVLELEREPVEKRIAIVDGQPVDCQSNLAHETFGRFLLAAGKLTPEGFSVSVSESLVRGVPLGEILIERGLLTPEETLRALQQNLARKLLDGFTWTSGSFRLDSKTAPAESIIRVNAPRLVLTGILKLSSAAEVARAVPGLLGELLAVSPCPPFPPADLMLTGAAAAIVETLARKPRVLNELVAATGFPFADLRRAVCALSVLEVVLPATQARRLEDSPRAVVPSAPDERRSGDPSAALPDDERLLLKSKVLETYLAFRRKDAFDLLGVLEEASREQIEGAYLERSRTFAPWRLRRQGLGEDEEKGTELFLAVARAYAELSDPEARAGLLFRRKELRDEAAERRHQEPRIQTDLLDPAVQYATGLDLLEKGDLGKALEYLEFAADCDPQNPIYRAEIAYRRYLFQPRRHHDGSIEELERAIRIDRQCGVAHYYLGVLHAAEGRTEAAEACLRGSIKLMAPDRRPIDALRELGKTRKK